MAQPDMELKKAFAEMQTNKQDTAKKLKMIDIQTDLFKTSKQKYLLTEIGTNDLEPEVRVYLSIGRMFVLTTVPNMREDLKVKRERCDTVIANLAEKKEYLNKSSKEQEDALREMVNQRKAQ